MRQSWAVVGFSLMSALAGCNGNHTTPVATPPPVVQVARPIQREVTDYELFTARTQAVQSIDIKARVTGYLTKIGFEDGKDVTAGQVLFEIDDRPYKAALDKANADLEVARANQVKTQAFLDIGLDVQKQNPGAVSQQEIVRRQGARDEAVGSVKQALAEIEDAQLNYDWCKVKSPITGRVNRHLVDVGDLVSQNVTQLTNVVSLKPIWAYFDVDQNAAEKHQQLVKEGKLPSARDGKLPVQMGLATDTGYPIAGDVDFVANQLDPNTGSIRLRGVFPNDDGKLMAGLFGRVRVPTGPPHNALLIPDSAVGTDQSMRYILVVNDKNEVEYRAVDVGQVFDGLREIPTHRKVTEPGGPGGTDVTKSVEVLKPTDRVIVNGLQRVRPGVKVDPKLVDAATLLLVDEPQSAAKTPTTAKKK